MWTSGLVRRIAVAKAAHRYYARFTPEFLHHFGFVNLPLAFRDKQDNAIHMHVSQA
jgi:hypothetical protein